jgi:hypothetical protein
VKHCNPCNTSKSLSEFSKNKSNKDGLQTRCKDCKNQHYQDNKDAILENQKQYNQDNKESIKQYHKQYDQDNKENILEYQRQLNISEGYGVYTLTHLPTQHYYVGEGQIHSRRKSHFSLLKRGKNKYGLLQEHYNKHPNINEWEFQVIRKWDKPTKSEGKKIENKLIKWGLENMPKKILNING